MQRPSNNEVTTTFGYVAGYPLNGGYHMGVDFSYIPDDVIYAPEDGNYRLYPDNGSLGNAIHMLTDNRHHAFGHTSKYLISDNQFVTRGTPIAVMGDTGAAQGVHLHWALAINGGLVDPLTQVNETFKGGQTVIPTKDLLNALFRNFRGREASPEEIDQYVGKVLYDDLIPVLDTGDEHNAWVDAAHLGQATSGTPAVPQSTLDQISQSNNILVKLAQWLHIPGF